MDRFLIVAAYYIVAAGHHSGQWSRGYLVLSRCERLGLKLAESAWKRGSDERREAARLLWKRRREVRREW